MSLSSIRSWFQKGNRAQWSVFILFCGCLFIKTMIFHFSVDYGILVSSLWKHPTEFLRFWGGKIAPILFLGSFIFLFKRFWWTYIVNLIIDLWCIANLFYFKANGLFLSYETMKMADNLSGFWDSLLSYMGLDIVSFVIFSIGYFLIVLYLLPRQVNQHYGYVWIGVLFVSLLISISNNVCYAKADYSWGHTNSATAAVTDTMLAGEAFSYYYPFGHVYYFACIEKCTDYNAWAGFYVKDYSILSYFPACIIFNILQPAGEKIQLKPEERVQIERFINNEIYPVHKPKTNIIFILFESLESWPLQPVCGHLYMPYLSKLINSDHILYCDKLKSQVKHANSMDGQMIDATGMLPIANGATCILFGTDRFPSYAECFPNSAILNPAPGMWRQSIVTKNYQFKQLIEPKKGTKWNGDEGLINNLIQYIDSVDTTFCAFAITVSSHVPFTRGSSNPKCEIEGMPLIMSAYVNCLSYTDSCIGSLIEHIQNSELAENTTIVISGDHTIFRSVNEEFDVFAKQHNIAMRTTKTYTPLIIYSPSIEGNIHVTDTCYQMDIYPTIMHLIGCEDYYWKGFGVNLLDSAARHNRPISEQEAYRLSDLMIRSDYFRQYLHK
ncbi:MAG: sulfatase-like hydrolase/transferase [Paludibacteraceae bacterium]|nr:sulfatase-like hydrolase/transferase [Paludibacteraceae bacterium]